MTLLASLATAAVALLSAAAFQAHDSAPPARLTVLESGHPVADVHVAGQGPFRFVIDTAATRTSLLQAFRTAYAGPLASVGNLDVPGSSGAAAVEAVTLPGLDVAGRGIGELEAWSLPPGPVDRLPVQGVLGADVLKRFALELDPAQGRWRLLDRHESEPALTYGAFRLDDGDAPVMPVTINGVELVAVIDTGAQATVLNAAAAERLGLSADAPGARSSGPARGTGPGATASYSICVASLSLVGGGQRPVRVRVADLPVFQALGLSGQPAVIVGYDQLGAQRIVIDYPNNRMGVDLAQKAARPPADDCP